MPIVSTGRTISTTEYLEKKQKVRRKRLLNLSILLGLLLLVVIIILKLPQLQIKEVRVSGATVTGEEVVEQGVEEALSGNYLSLVPKRNILLYRKDHMKEELSRQFPRLNSIDISLDNFKTLNISVVEREPFALYCESVEKCFFIDEHGFIFDQAPSFSEGVYFVYTHEPPLLNPLGQFMVQEEEFGGFKDFVNSLTSLGFKPLSALVSFEDVSVRLLGEGIVRFSREHDPQRTLINLEAFLTSPTIANEKDFLNRVSELDLRTEDRVFYKFKN